MKNFWKFNISNLEKYTLITYLIIIVLSLYLQLLKPISPVFSSNMTYFFQTLKNSILIYILSKWSTVLLIRTIKGLWSGLWIWEHRRNFVIYVLHGAMYLFAFFSIISIYRGVVSFNSQLILYGYGFLGALIGGVNGKKQYLEEVRP